MNSMVGLTEEEVQERIRAGKVNYDAGVKTKSVSQIVKGNVFTLFNFVNLLLAAALVFVQSYRNMLFVGVVFWNLFIGIVQELRAKHEMDKLSILSEGRISVVRDGIKKEIPIHEVVEDDLVHFKSGMQVCADSVVVKGECEVNESLLTGESVPVTKHEGDELLSGSFLVSGDVYAEMKQVGANSYANRITSGAKYLKPVNSEIKSAVMKIIKVVSIAIFPVALIFFWNQIRIPDATLQTAVVNTVAALLGMFPEGLVLLISVVMAVSVIRLAQKKTLVQQMYSVETLARVDVFCLDKTGTLTEGTMHMSGYETVSNQQFEKPLSEVMGAMKEGNATFDAINEIYHSEEWKVRTRIPFSSERKWCGVTFEEKGTFLLGAPEFVLQTLDEKQRAIIETHTARGERVLVFAYSSESLESREKPHEIKALAYLFIEDTIKESAPETISYLKNQNVKLKVISGDNPKAVSDIARKVGVQGAEKYIDCSKVNSQEELMKLAEENTVFGRVSPQQKQVLIKALKKKHTVAMTGDGVNDVLALKESDCGIAMQAGSDAARNVADVILMNSDFVSIPDIIAEGRRTINNLQRSATLFLIKTVFSILLAVVFCFLNRKYPYQPIQMTLISSICIGIPSFILALENNFNRVTPGFFRKISRIALPGGILVAVNVILCVFFKELLNMNQEQVSTMTTFMGAGVFAVVLLKICYPFTMLRGALLASLACVFAGAVFVLAPVFFITELPSKAFVVMAGMEIGNIVLFLSVQKMIDKKWPICYDV